MLWVKPSGIEIEANDRKETIAYCESLGWKRKGEKPTVVEAAKEPEKRTRRTKAQMAADRQ